MAKTGHLKVCHLGSKRWISNKNISSNLLVFYEVYIRGFQVPKELPPKVIWRENNNNKPQGNIGM